MANANSHGKTPTWSIPVEAGPIPAFFDPPLAPSIGTFLCAPGAGGHASDRGMLQVSEALTHRGIGVIRYHFPYREQGRRYPDPMPRLTACVAEVVEFIRREVGPDRLVVGGRSMGGRVASVAVAEGLPADGLLLLAYPLHPPGQPEKLRDEHLPRISLPTLCLNGTRDPFCDRARMEAVVARLNASWTMHWIDGADHSFHLPRRSVRSEADVFQQIGETIRAWLSALSET